MNNTHIIGGADGPTAIFIASSGGVSFGVLLFTIILSLLLVHEMDAIRAKEWKMFAIFKNMTEEKACGAFILLHLPLFLVVLYILSNGGPVATRVLQTAVDLFLLAHAALHYGFRKHSANGFRSRFSKFIIYSDSALAFLHLCLLYTL